MNQTHILIEYSNARPLARERKRFSFFLTTRTFKNRQMARTKKCAKLTPTKPDEEARRALRCLKYKCMPIRWKREKKKNEEKKKKKKKTNNAPLKNTTTRTKTGTRKQREHHHQEEEEEEEEEENKENEDAKKRVKKQE